jgi:hypothetical protein
MPRYSQAVNTAKRLRSSKLTDAWIMVIIKQIAFLVSMFSFAAGTIVFGVIQSTQITPPILMYLTVVFFALMGGMTSLLCEGLTVSNCKKLVKALNDYKAAHEKTSQVPDTSEEVRKRKAMMLYDAKAKVRSFSAAVLVTSAISFIGGMLFWHWLLSNASPFVAWMTSSAFSALVSIALVYSTISENTTEAIVEQSIKGGNLVVQAVDADISVELGEAYHENMHEALKDQVVTGDDMKELTRSRFQHLADKVLNGNGQISNHLQNARQERIEAEREAMMKLDNLYVTTPSGIVIPEKSGNRNKERNIKKVKDLLHKEGIEKVQDMVTDGSLADMLGVSQPTVYRYMDDIKAESNF